MGQAKLRGTFEQRQQEGIVKRIEREKDYAEYQKARQEHWNQRMKDNPSLLPLMALLETLR